MFVLAKAHPFFHQSAPHMPNTPHSTYMLLIYSLLCLFPTQASFSVIDHCLLRGLFMLENHCDKSHVNYKVADLLLKTNSRHKSCEQWRPASDRRIVVMFLHAAWCRVV